MYTVTHGYEFDSGGNCLDNIIYLCNTLRLLGGPICKKIHMFEDNKYVVDSVTHTPDNIHDIQT